MSHFTLIPNPSAPKHARRLRRSALLSSASRRMMAALVASAALWALTGWALGWWGGA